MNRNSGIPSDLKLVILDCDGVLIDSHQSNIAFYNCLLGQMNQPPLTLEGAELAQVYSTPQLLQHLFPKSPEKIEKGIQIAGALDYLPFLEYLAPKPGLFDVLKALKSRYRLALATNRGASLIPLLKRFNLEDSFEVTASILTVSQPKPAPDMLLYCLEKTGISPEEAIYVGDMENDLVSAEAAGMAFILMGSRFKYHHQIQVLTDLPKLLGAD